MKINIASIYWLVFWGLFLACMTAIPLILSILQSMGYKLFNITYVPTELNSGNIGNYIGTLLIVIFFILVHFWMLQKRKFVWYVCLSLYAIGCMVSTISLLSTDYLSNLELMKEFLQPGYSIFIFLQFLIFGSLLMNYFTLYALIAERRLFVR